jgi:TPR repeat protein
MLRPSIVLVIALVASGCAANMSSGPPSAEPRLPDDPRVRACAEASNEHMGLCEGASGLRRGEQANPDVVKQAFAYFDRSCQRGQAADCYRAMQYAGDARTFGARAHRSCELGFAIACTKLAFIVDQAARDGGGAKVQAWALGFGQRGCMLGDAPACMFMGLRLEAGGPGLASDAAQAAFYFRIACEKFLVAPACEKLQTAPAPETP